MADPRMVPKSDADVHPPPNQTGTGKKPILTAGKAKRKTPSEQIANPSSLPLIRQQLSDTIDILLAPWRQTTGRQYNTYLYKWLLYCQENNVDMTQANITEGLAFLTHLWNQGLGYSAIKAGG